MRRYLIVGLIGLFAVVLASHALAGAGNEQGRGEGGGAEQAQPAARDAVAPPPGAGICLQDQQRVRARLRDGSCLAAGAVECPRAGAGACLQDQQRVRARLRDGSCGAPWGAQRGWGGGRGQCRRSGWGGAK